MFDEIASGKPSALIEVSALGILAPVATLHQAMRRHQTWMSVPDQAVDAVGPLAHVAQQVEQTDRVPPFLQAPH